jgi:hypothetical protein
MYSYFKKQNKYKLLSYILIFFTSLNYIFFTHRFFQRENGFILGDWLINYEGGFSRRGLFGEAILNLKVFLNIGLINLTFIIVVFLYLIFIYLLIRLISKSNINFLIALFIFSPVTILFNFYDPLAIGRKEILFFLFMICYLLYNQSKFFIYLGTLAAILITLSHELFALLTPFLFIAKYLDTRSYKFKTYFLEIIISFFSSVVFLLILFLKDPNTTEVCNNIKQFGLSDNACWAINAMSGKPLQILQYWRDSYYSMYYSIFLTLIFILIFINLKKNFDLNYIKIFLIVFLSFFPIFLLFFLVNDWGRYLNVYSMFWMMILISKNNKKNNSKPNFIGIAAIIIFSLSWYMPHCCPERHFTTLKYKPGIYYIFERLIYRLNN